MIVFLCGLGNKGSATVGVSSVFVPLVAQVTTIWAGRDHRQSRRPSSVTSSLRTPILRRWLRGDSGSGSIDNHPLNLHRHRF